MKMKAMATVAAVSLVLVQVACGGGDTNPNAPAAATPPALGPVDPALVGTWTGTVDGVFGPARMTATLSADSTTTWEGTGRYCRAYGNWGVTGAQFNARISDCDATQITSVAPVSSTTLVGTYTTSRGGSGTFSVTRQ